MMEMRTVTEAAGPRHLSGGQPFADRRNGGEGGEAGGGVAKGEGRKDYGER